MSQAKPTSRPEVIMTDYIATLPDGCTARKTSTRSLKFLVVQCKSADSVRARYVEESIIMRDAADISHRAGDEANRIKYDQLADIAATKAAVFGDSSRTRWAQVVWSESLSGAVGAARSAIRGGFSVEIIEVKEKP